MKLHLKWQNCHEILRPLQAESEERNIWYTSYYQLDFDIFFYNGKVWFYGIMLWYIQNTPGVGQTAFVDYFNVDGDCN